jgi:hypothetical protein
MPVAFACRVTTKAAKAAWPPFSERPYAGQGA